MILVMGAVREEDVVFSAAGHTHVGGAQGNTLGIDALKVDEQSASNAGIVTITALGVTVVSLPSMTVAAGDRVLVCVVLTAVKGATAGDVGVVLDQSAGTATGAFAHDSSFLRNIESVLANGNLSITLAGVYKIAGAGTMTLRLFGESSSSDSSVAVGAADIHALVLRGTG